MLKTFGRMPATKPEGMGARVHFPVLCRMDLETGDHRFLDSEGGDSRDLPLSIRCQFASTYGHDGAVPTGALFEATFDSDTGIVSGDGWLLDNDNGRDHALLIATGSQRGNSVDLAEVKARFEENLSEDEEWSYRIRFTKWKLAATTGVGTPAFADARAEIRASATDEVSEIIAAAVAGDQPLVCETEFFELNVLNPADLDIDVPAELLASGQVQPYDAFFQAETDRPKKAVPDANGWLCGHLGLWETPHDGVQGRQVLIPRPKDNYASFNKPGVLTNRGIVNTGPIFAYGGHRPGRGVADLDKAYGGIENAWADVRITEGRLGPWISGIVRPGVDDTTVYAARASRLSGHWLGGRLKAIVSVNAEGYDVPGHADDEDGLDLAASFAFSIDADGVLELVAGLPASVGELDPTATLSELDVDRIASAVAAKMSAPAEVVVAAETPVVGSLAARRRQAMMALHHDDEAAS